MITVSSLCWSRTSLITFSSLVLEEDITDKVSSISGAGYHFTQFPPCTRGSHHWTKFPPCTWPGHHWSQVPPCIWRGYHFSQVTSFLSFGNSLRICRLFHQKARAEKAPSMAIQSVMFSLCQPIQANLEPFGAIWSYLESIWPIWSHLEPFGATWNHWELFGAICSHLEPFRAI